MYSLQELRTSTIKELQLELEQARRELLRVRIGLKTKHLKDSSLASKNQVYIAQILTLLKEAEKAPKAAATKEAPVAASADAKKKTKEPKAKKAVKSKKVTSDQKPVASKK